MSMRDTKTNCYPIGDFTLVPIRDMPIRVKRVDEDRVSINKEDHSHVINCESCYSIDAQIEFGKFILAAKLTPDELSLVLDVMRENKRVDE